MGFGTKKDYINDLWVIPFPMTCDLQTDCSCRDPAAQENSMAGQQRFLG
ncbi:Pappalysin-1 [Acipenser ruthenus]|uniref:Pappalysin-1 n=1 Tax=Acipenser ruthenus TaxID=7906 RepID=A0A444V2Q5_ACIRT|nr:Pappalysin-1 [Acipenser ruthenus]